MPDGNVKTWEEVVTDCGITVTEGKLSSISNKVALQGKLFLPNSITSIGYRAFYNCTGLTSIVIPNTVTNISNNTFEECTSLSSITFSDNIIEIGYMSFSNCTSLNSITLPDNIISISNDAFENSSIVSIVIPSKTTMISDNPFTYCKSLSKIEVNENNTMFDSRNNCNAIIESSTNKLICGCKNTVIPNDVTSIGNYSFIGSELQSIIIPDSITTISASAFYNCNSLYSISLSKNLRTIEMYAFYNCNNISSITIPDSVKTIGGNAFYNVPHIEYHGTATGAPWGAKSIN